MPHGITAKACIHGIGLEGVKEEYFATIVIHEVIFCLNTVLRTGHISQIDD